MPTVSVYLVWSKRFRVFITVGKILATQYSVNFLKFCVEELMLYSALWRLNSLTKLMVCYVYSIYPSSTMFISLD